MKTGFITNLTLVYLLIGVSLTYSQEEIPWEVKQKLINQLDSSDVRGVISSLRGYNVIEAKEKIEQVFWNTNFGRSDQYGLLELLYKFGSNLTHDYALAYIDTLEVNPFGNNTFGLSVLYYQVLSSKILMKLGDYSKANLVFEYLQYEYPKISQTEISILEKLLNNTPQYYEAAKTELQRAVHEASFYRDRYYAFEVLYNHNQQETLPLMKQMFVEDEDPANRLWVLDTLTIKHKDEEIHMLLKQRLSQDTDFFLRYMIAMKLIYSFGLPSDYKFVKNYLPNETNLEIKEGLLRNMSVYRPRKPDSSASSIGLLNDLIDITDTVYSYTWLGDLQFKDELQLILQTAKTNLLNGDSLACAVKVKSFQDLVDFVYKDSLNTDARFVTLEGWNFLYWNAQYILDRLPEIPIVVAADIDVINPAMSLVNPGTFTMEVKGSGFSSSSVVYFNGNARATTFVSDSTLNAQILSTDVSVAGNFPVWVSDNTLNSDTLIYKVVSTLPQPVRPVLECVTNNGDGTYTAFFGYKNENSVSVYIPVGSKNKFTPNPQDRGQTRVLLPGRQIKIYTVNFNGSNLVWTLNGRTSTASANSAPCQ